VGGATTYSGPTDVARSLAVTKRMNGRWAPPLGLGRCSSVKSDITLL
jgi:hypothetical protein